MLKISNVLALTTVLLTLFTVTPAHAQSPAFEDGPVITGFGKHAPVPTHTVSENDEFTMVFDASSAAKPGEVNRKFDSLARFINMHVAAGAKKENIKLALVVHGKAMFDLLKHEGYKKKHDVDAENANVALLKALMENNVRVIACGQSAAALGIDSSQLVEGIQVELSAMTVRARLQQQGYALNP